MSSQPTELRTREEFNRDIRRTDYNRDIDNSIARDDRNRSYTTQIEHARDEYKNQIDYMRKMDFKSEYQLDSNKNETQSRIDYISNQNDNFECDSSRQERSNHDIDSIDSFDRFLELERETIDYEKDLKEERLGVEKRRLDTEQIMMFQLSKIIKMLERTHF